MAKTIEINKNLVVILCILILLIFASSLYINYQVRNLPLVDTKLLTNESNESLYNITLNNISMIEDGNDTATNESDFISSGFINESLNQS